ncbi:MAG: zinc-binding dehydrogenase [Candidatus Brocadiaceae bacterium]|nr:zinc-binding dehydrogenase [Candidatus Brocadiaceae bacterium]
MLLRTRGVRLYGKRDLRLEAFDLPEPTDDEILAQVVTNSICMSSHKAAEQGADHKRVPADVAQNPVLIGHEFAGRLIRVGRRWADRFEPGQLFAIQPAINYKGALTAPGYSYPHIGGNATFIIIPSEVMEMGCLLPYTGDAFFKASLAEPMSCIVGAFRAQYHWEPGSAERHEMGIREGGDCALLASAGPMGLGAIDFALHGPRRPGRLLVTDMDPERLEHARRLFPPDEGTRQGVELVFLNPADLPGGPGELAQFVREWTGGAMMDDVFVLFPSERLIEQADALLGRNGCLNFFAGPPRTDFRAALNFYDVHYEGHHIVGTSGGNTEDMLISLDLMSAGRLQPGGMITHVGGLDAAAQTILNLPQIHGGKKLIYTQLSMPLVGLDELGARAEQAAPPLRDVLQELDRVVADAGGVWSAEAERVLLGREELRFPEE